MHYNTGGISFHLVNETTITRVFQIALRGGGGEWEILLSGDYFIWRWESEEE